MPSECVSCGSTEPPEYVPDAFSEMCVECGHMFSTSSSTFITYEADPESGPGNWDPTAGSARIHAGDVRLRRGPLTSTVGGRPRVLPGQTALMDKADHRGYTAATNLPDVYALIEGVLRRLGHEGNPYTERAKQLFDQARTIGMEKREVQAREDARREISSLSRSQKKLRKEARWGTESFSMGAAAVYVTLKKGGKDFALEDVAKAAAQSLSRVKIQLRHLDHLFHGTDVLNVLRAYDPAVFIPDYVSFLETQRKPVDGRPGPAAAAIGREGLAYLSKLDAPVLKGLARLRAPQNVSTEPGSSSPLWRKAMQLALDLAALCVAEGHARHKGDGGVRDIRRMAYAIVLCGIEGTLKLVSPQTQIIDSWAAAEQWRDRQERQREREEIRLEREAARQAGEQVDNSEDEFSDSDEDYDEEEDVEDSRREEAIRARYNELIRLVLPSVAAAQWELGESPTEKFNREKRERLATKKSKMSLAEVGSYPAQRAKFVDTMAFAVKARIQLQAKLQAEQRAQQGRAPPVVGPATAGSSRQAGRQAATASAPAAVSPSRNSPHVATARSNPQRALGISQLKSLHTAAQVLEDGNGQPSFAQELQLDVTSAALQGKRSIKQQAKKAAEIPLSKRVPQTILRPGVLETLEEAAIDALLFEEGEMEKYFRSAKEREMLHRVKAQDGSWDGYGETAERERTEKRSETSAAKRKRQESEREGEEEEPEEEDVEVVGYLDD